MTWHRWLRGCSAALLLLGLWLAVPMPPSGVDRSICRAPISGGVPDGLPPAAHDHCVLCQIAAPALPPPVVSVPKPTLLGAVSAQPGLTRQAPELAQHHPYASRAPPRLV
jgi:hypothetical protein